MYFPFSQINKAETDERMLASLKVEKEELESSLAKERMQLQQLKQELAVGESCSMDLYKVTLQDIHYML